MRKITVMLLTTMLILGCASEGRFIASNVPNSCDGTGHSFVIIHYGDSRILVIPIVEIKAGAELQYRLLPDRRKSDLTDYEDTLVTISGKLSPDGDWMNESGTFNGSDGVLKVCVPENPTEETYFYKVEVAGVGDLDPRAHVR